jgi:single-stranded DNA-binding protein
MTIHALISGTLFRPPESRTSKAGTPFVTATIRVKDGEAAQWWRVTAFSETAQAELMRLGDGDALSVQGSFKAELYDKDGDKRLSLSLVADCVLALRQQRRTKSAPDTRSRQERLAGSWQSPADGPYDDIGF